MDTGTHLVFGIGLAGLSFIDPVVASDMSVATAVFIGTSIGSQAPDFDGVLRLKSNAAYIKNHRGKSHSLPAIALWTLFISGGLKLFFTGVPFATLSTWVLLAVMLHVFVDLFNTYGTQALRPFTQKWISWNIIHIFDPVIFSAHIAAIVIWMLHLASPQLIFPSLYAGLALYYIWRAALHSSIQKRLPTLDAQFESGDHYLLIPTYHLGQWNVVKSRTEQLYKIGEFKRNQLHWIDEMKCTQHPAIEASKLHPDIAALLYFSSYACAELRTHHWGYEVRWIDVRYRHRKQYPFVGVILMDHQYQTIDSYVGWLNNERIGKKLGMNSQ